jgi:hypothetical protein
VHETTLRFTDELWRGVRQTSKREGISAAQFVRDATVARIAGEDHLHPLHIELGASLTALDRRMQRLEQTLQCHGLRDSPLLSEAIPGPSLGLECLSEGQGRDPVFSERGKGAESKPRADLRVCACARTSGLVRAVKTIYVLDGESLLPRSGATAQIARLDAGAARLRHAARELLPFPRSGPGPAAGRDPHPSECARTGAQAT